MQFSDPLEGVLLDKGEKEKLGHKETVRLRLAGDPLKSLQQYEVLGLPTADCDFV